MPDRRHFDGVMVFLRVAELRSFRAAAEELGLSPSAVGHIVRSLEARIGVPLLARTTRRVGLTQAGERFIEGARQARRLLAEATEAARSLAGTPAGTLRLSVSRVVADVLVGPLVRGFCARHPGLDVELCADDRVSDLVGEGFDAGIQLAELVPQDMVAVELLPPFPFVVVASPEYLSRHPAPRRPEDLGAHRCIRFRMADSQGEYRWEFVRRGRPLAVGVGGGVIVNDTLLCLRAALAGGGLAYLAEPVVRAAVRDGRLLRVLDEFMPRSRGLMLCYPSRSQALPKLQAFRAFTREWVASGGFDGGVPAWPRTGS